MLNTPVVCKILYTYTYRKKLKERYIYVLLLCYTAIDNGYYDAIFIEENGKHSGKNYDKRVKWDDDTIGHLTVPMDQLPQKVLKTVKEEIEIYEEVIRRTSKNKNKSIT